MRLHVRRLFQNNVDWAKKYYNLFIAHFFFFENSYFITDPLSINTFLRRLYIFQIPRQASNPCLVRLEGPKQNRRGEWTSLRKAALSVQNQVSLNEKDLNAVLYCTLLSQAPDVIMFFLY